MPYFSVISFATIDCVADEGVGPEDFEDPEDFVEPGSSPLTMSMKPFLCISYSTLLLLHRKHDEMVATLVGCLHSSSLILALCMTLPFYEGYAGGSR